MGTRNKTIADLERTFQSQMKEFEEKLKSVQEPGGFVQGTISIETLKMEFEAFRLEISTKLEKIAEGLEQKNFSKNILIYGIKEDREEDIFPTIIDLFKNQLNIDIDKNQISSCYRIGKKPSGPRQNISKHRPIVVEFVCQWMRDIVFARKSKLKGSGVVLVEMLVKSKLLLFKKVREKYRNNCWTIRGNIKVVVNNKIVQIESEEHFSRLETN